MITMSTFNPITSNPIHYHQPSINIESSVAQELMPITLEAEQNIEYTLPQINLRVSAFTSQGKRKASRIDPIRTLEDINKAKNYFLNNGRSEQIRLRNHALFVLGISIGIRPDDLLHLHFYDIITPSGNIVKELPVCESKTNKMNRPIINEEARSALATYIDSLSSFSYSDFIFHSQGNPKTPMKPDTLYKLMVKMSESLNFKEHIGAYTLRKTFAYWTIKLHPNDMNVMISLQEMLNHDSMHTTLHYSGICSDDIKVMYNDISNVFNTHYKTPTAIKPTKEIKTLVSSLLEQIYSEE